MPLIRRHDDADSGDRDIHAEGHYYDYKTATTTRPTHIITTNVMYRNVTRPKDGAGRAQGMPGQALSGLAQDSVGDQGMSGQAMYRPFLDPNRNMP